MNQVAAQAAECCELAGALDSLGNDLEAEVPANVLVGYDGMELVA